MEKMISASRVKKILAVIFLLTLTGMAGSLPINLDARPPVIGGSDPALVNAINEEIRRNFNNFQDLIPDEFQGIGIDEYPRNLIGSFATSSVFSSNGASLRGFQGYNTFALTVGAMAGFQLPVNVFSMFNNLANIESELEKLLNDVTNSGDIQLGANLQVVNAQLGINTRFIKGLYLGVKGGYMKLPILNLDEFQASFQTWSIGGLINYQLIPQFRLLGGIIVWRGLNLGAGYIYQNTSMNVGVSGKSFIQDNDATFPIPIEYGGTTGTITGKIQNPKLELGFNVNTYTVPLEVVTSFRFLGFLNASIGGGVDFGFGGASMGGSINADIDVYDFPAGLDLYRESKGSFSGSLGGLSPPNRVNPKIMASFGFSAGSVIVLDIPFTYYFQNNGYNIGVSFGVAF